MSINSFGKLQKRVGKPRAVQELCNSSVRQITGFRPSAPKGCSYSEVGREKLSNDRLGRHQLVRQPRNSDQRGPGAIDQRMLLSKKCDSTSQATSSGAAGVGLEKSAEASRADDLAHLECDLLVGWFLASGRQVVARAVGAFLVVPGSRLADQVVQVPLSHHDEVVQDLLLQSLDDTFHVRLQVRGPGRVAFASCTTGFQYIVKLSRELLPSIDYRPAHG